MALSILRVLKLWLAFIIHYTRAFFDWLRLTYHTLALHQRFGRNPHRLWRAAPTDRLTGHYQAKPAWVKREVLRLKALMPHSGCRKISDCFNRRFECARHMTVSKSYVANTVRQHIYEIAILRRQIKNAKPKADPKHCIRFIAADVGCWFLLNQRCIFRLAPFPRWYMS